LFAAFLGYNPMKQLLGPLLAHLPVAHAAYVAGRQFFPQLITTPFHDGLQLVFAFTVAVTTLAAVVARLTRPRWPDADTLRPGNELDSVTKDEPARFTVSKEDDPRSSSPAKTAAAAITEWFEVQELAQKVADNEDLRESLIATHSDLQQIYVGLGPPPLHLTRGSRR